MGCSNKTGKCVQCRYEDGWWAVDDDHFLGNICVDSFYLDKMAASTNTGTTSGAKTPKTNF